MSARPLNLSVIIPARDRLDVLRRVIDGLCRQELEPDRFEVIVVDDGSSDGTKEYLCAQAKKTPFALVPLQGGGEGAAAARNRALAVSRGEIILFLDADTIPSAELLRRHLELQSRAEGPECHLGRIDMSAEVQEPAQARWHELRLAAGDPVTGEIDFRRYRTANSSMPRSTLQVVRGFEPRLQVAEDLELAYRLARAGVRFYYHSDILAVHHHPLRLEEYLRKGSLYGEAVARWRALQPEMATELARRFGLYEAGLGFTERCRYRIKALLVNGASVRLLTALAGFSRRVCFAASQRLLRAVYGYHLRRSFLRSRLQPGM